MNPVAESLKEAKMSHESTVPAAITLSMIIPAYNEGRRLPDKLREIRAYLTQQGWTATTEIIVVDDGSRDDTVVQVARLVRGWPGLSIITLPHAGKGAALRQGTMVARGDYLLFCDADLSMPLAELPRFLPPASPLCDIVIASREAPGARRFNEPAYRHVMGRGFNWLVRQLVLAGIRDTQCGFKRLTRAAARELCALQRQNGFTFDVELLALARARGYTIAEIPIDWYHSTNSRVRPVRDTIAMFGAIWQVRQRLRDPRLHNDSSVDRAIEASGIPAPHKAVAALLARRRANSRLLHPES